MKRLWYLTAFIPFLLAAAWDAALEADPADTDPVSAGAGEIRDTRSEVRQRAETDLCWGSFDTTGCPAGDEGRLREGGARAFHDASAPTVLNAEDRAGSDALDEGRLWADSDTPSATIHRLQVYDGSGWEDVEAGYAAALTDATDSDDQVLAGSHNLIYNGDFAATSGTGLTTSTTVPAGWTASTTPTIAYSNTSGDIRWGAGYFVTVTDDGGGGDYIQQSLPSLAASTTYKVIARAKDDGTGTCRLDVTNEGGTAFSAATTSTDDWETLSGTFGTGAALDTVEVQLISVTASRVCSFDNVQVYQVGDVTTDRDEVNYGYGITRVRATYAGAALDCGNGYTNASCRAADSGLEVYVTPPGPGYIIQVTASVDVSLVSNSQDNCSVRLTDATNVLDEAFISTSDEDGGQDEAITTKLHATVINPTPGTTINFEIDANESGTASSECEIGTSVDSWIEALLIPTR